MSDCPGRSVAATLSLHPWIEGVAMKTVAAARRVLISALFILTLSAGLPLTADAAHDDTSYGSADVTFTGWETTAPPGLSTSAGAGMTGVAWGDVGRARYRGRILSGNDTFSQPHLWLGDVRYEFQGQLHSFVARVRVTEIASATPITATIQGVVTTGWLRGARVTGTYKYWTFCPMPTPGNKAGRRCYQGTLHLGSQV
jgi:hypothetical protein